MKKILIFLAFLFLFPLNSLAAQDPNLVASYGFEDGTGTVLTDNSGNNNNGTLINGPTWTTSGKFGKALTFDGSNDYVRVLDSNLLDLTTGMTLEAWVYPTTNMSGFDSVLMKERTSNHTYALYANTTSNFPGTYIYQGSSSVGTTSGAKLAANTWTHLAATYDGTTLKLYKNGILQSSLSSSGSIGTSTGNLLFGGSTVWSTRDFAGRLDEIRIYNRALSITEINSDMNTAIVDVAPTPTALPTSTNTPTIFPSPTFTPSPTATNTPTIVLTSTPTQTPTFTPTLTSTPTPTSTSSPTNTPTISPTPTSATTFKLIGISFGATPPYAVGNEFDKAWDSSTSTFYDYLNPNGGYTGLDLGVPTVVSSIKYYPRSTFASRMVGGKFQGSNASKTSGYVDLYTISTAPGYSWTQVNISNTTAYRYVRYLAPNNAYGNVAEIELWSGTTSPTSTPSPTSIPSPSFTPSPTFTPTPTFVPTATPTPYPNTPAYPVKSVLGQRYLVDQNNKPFLIIGDAAWSAIAQLSTSDAAFYLDNRFTQGFNSIIVSLIEHTYSSNAPKNYYGQSPFTGTAFSSTPNETYFANADAFISAAAQRGINVFLDPLYLGYQCGSDGWCGEVQAASVQNMQSWGTYVGNRYKNFPNIIWMIGGDADPTPVKSKVDAFATALKAADGNHLITAHNNDESLATTHWSGYSWLSLNNTYTYTTNLYQFNKIAYDISPVMPYFLLESSYENANSTDQQRRAQTYWTILSGGNGHIFGNCPVWHFGGVSSYVLCNIQTTDWKSWLNQQGSKNMTYAKTLFDSMSWQNLVPDWDHTVLTSGYGTWGQTDYATAAKMSDNSALVVYLPTSRTVTINMSELIGNSTAKWYDPSNGIYTQISGSFANTGSQQFTPPGNNFQGNDDWVLVINSTPNPTSTPIPTATPTPTIIPTSVPTPAPVFLEINHETGDLSQYTAAETDSGDLSITSTAALAGTSKGLSVLIDDNARLYAYKMLDNADTSGIMRARFYIDPNGLHLGNLEQVSFIFFGNSTGQSNFAQMKLMNIDGQYYLRGVMIDDNEIHNETAAWPISDEPHYVEIKVTRATSDTASDAAYETWIDGIQKQTMTNVDSYNKFSDLKIVGAGVLNTGGTISGNYYIDEIKVNNDGSPIGPVIQ